MVEKRSTLTLGQKIGSKNKELEMSNDIKNQLLLRQQKLKVSQKDKNKHHDNGRNHCHLFNC